MIFELKKKFYERVRSLFKEIDYQLTIRAVIEGTSPGRIYVDDVDNPSSAFMCSAEGYYLAGKENNDDFNDALRDLIISTIFSGDTLRTDDDDLVLCVDPENWTAKFDIIFPTRPPLQMLRKYYTCTKLRINWENQIPKGFSIHRLDRKFMAKSNMNIPEHIPYWMKTNWGSINNFMQRGFGFCMVHGNEVVSWCIADCVSGNECEIGIRTRPEFRRQGLATLTAAATVDFCLSKGFTKIGWHSNEENLGSIGVAEKVGFVKTREYIWYYCMLDEATHLAETGLRKYLARQYKSALDYFKQAFSKKDVAHWFYHLAALTCAALGKRDAAIKYLNQAVDHGWRNIEYSMKCSEFKILHGTEEWQNVLDRMRTSA